MEMAWLTEPMEKGQHICRGLQGQWGLVPPLFPLSCVQDLYQVKGSPHRSSSLLQESFGRAPPHPGYARWPQGSSGYVGWHII